MKELTPQQERFAQLVATGSSQSRAYRDAYDVKPRTKKATVWDNAYTVAHLPHVRARIAALKEEVAKRAVLSRTEYLEWLLTMARRCELEGDMSNARAYASDYGKASGFFSHDDDPNAGKPRTAADALGVVDKLLDAIKARGLPIPASFTKVIEALPAPKQQAG